MTSWPSGSEPFNFSDCGEVRGRTGGLRTGRESGAHGLVERSTRNGEVLDKFAVVYALWNNPKKALESLEQAFKLEYHPVWVRQDPDLRNISNQPRFQALINQMGR